MEVDVPIEQDLAFSPLKSDSHNQVHLCLQQLILFGSANEGLPLRVPMVLPKEPFGVRLGVDVQDGHEWRTVGQPTLASAALLANIACMSCCDRAHLVTSTCATSLQGAIRACLRGRT